MSYNREYPYVDAGRMDTDWLINQVKELAEKLKDGIGYRLSIDGRVLSLIGNDGSVSRVTLPEGGGGGGVVTYGLRRNGQVIELRGSDGSVSTVFAPILTVDSHLSSTSTNPVQNKAIKEALDNKADVEDIPSIPTRLPNPQALTFTGAASGSYDGSSAMTVNIPEGGGGGGDYFYADVTLDTATGAVAIPFNTLLYRHIVISIYQPSDVVTTGVRLVAGGNISNALNDGGTSAFTAYFLDTFDYLPPTIPYYVVGHTRRNNNPSAETKITQPVRYTTTYTDGVVVVGTSLPVGTRITVRATL